MKVWFKGAIIIRELQRALNKDNLVKLSNIFCHKIFSFLNICDIIIATTANITASLLVTHAVVIARMSHARRHIVTSSLCSVYTGERSVGRLYNV
jgi:hypothetical protein